MGNLTENKLNTILSAADITAINSGAADVTEKLPVVGLTDEQRSSLRAIDVDNKVFVEDVITEIGISGDGILPGYINSTFIQNDLTLFEQMDAGEATFLNILQKISDIKRVAGSEAYDMALAVYRMYEAASNAGIPGAKQAYDKLKKRFDAQGNFKGRSADPAP